jgi:hypothetical protein
VLHLRNDDFHRFLSGAGVAAKGELLHSPGALRYRSSTREAGTARRMRRINQDKAQVPRFLANYLLSDNRQYRQEKLI